MKSGYKCNFCKETDDNKFYSHNKSTCKKCDTSRSKVRKLKVRSDDEEVKNYCSYVNLDFEQLCRDSEDKSIHINTDIPSIKPTEMDTSEKLKKFKKSIKLLTERINELETKINEKDSRIVMLEKEIILFQEMMRIIADKMSVK